MNIFKQKRQKQRIILDKIIRMEKKKTKRETLHVSRATIDITSDAMSDASSDCNSFEENLSPVRRVRKLLQSSGKLKPRRKKKMPPELKILPVLTSDSPLNLDQEKKSNKYRPRSVSVINDHPTQSKLKLKPASWHLFQRLPPPKCLSEIKGRNMQPSELQVKLNSLKKNIWTGVQDEEKGPLSWGVSSFAMNSYFTDSEALLRSCSKKLEELEGDKQKMKDEKKKKKIRNKKVSVKVPNAEDVLEPINKIPKTNKRKGKLKHARSENSTHINNTSFTDIPRNTQPQNRQAKSAFRKSVFVATAIQSKKTHNKKNIISDNSDSEESIQTIKKVKKKSKIAKHKLQKATTATK